MIDQVRVGIVRLGFLLGGDGIVQFVVQFGHFQRRQKLPRLHPVAKIHLHLPHITRDLGMQLDFHVGPEFGRKGHFVAKVLARDTSHRDRQGLDCRHRR